MWQPIETCPKDGGGFLVTDKNFPPGIIPAYWSEDQNRVISFDAEVDMCWRIQGVDVGVMWMPLPAPPGDAP